MNRLVKSIAAVPMGLFVLGLGADAIQRHQFGSFFANAANMVRGRIGAPKLMYAVPLTLDATTKSWITTRLEICGDVQVPLADGYELRSGGDICTVANTPKESPTGDRITFEPMKDRRNDGKNREREASMAEALAALQGPKPDGKSYSQIEVFEAAMMLSPSDYSLMDEGTVGLAKFLLLNQKKTLLKIIGPSNWVQYHVGKLVVVEGDDPSRPGGRLAMFGKGDGTVYRARYNVDADRFRGFLAVFDNPPNTADLAAGNKVPEATAGVPTTSIPATKRQPASQDVEAHPHN